MEIAGRLGFSTRYGDGGYYGIAETGEGQELLGILGVHLDVVPAGNLAEWDHDPFDPVEVDGILSTGAAPGSIKDLRVCSRFVFDVKALMDAGVHFNERVRLIFGGDQKIFWRCIKHYKVNEEIPDLGFSPNSRFPVTYAGEGLLQAAPGRRQRAWGEAERGFDFQRSAQPGILL